MNPLISQTKRVKRMIRTRNNVLIIVLQAELTLALSKAYLLNYFIYNKIKTIWILNYLTHSYSSSIYVFAASLSSFFFYFFSYFLYFFTYSLLSFLVISAGYFYTYFDSAKADFLAYCFFTLFLILPAVL